VQKITGYSHVSLKGRYFFTLWHCE